MLVICLNDLLLRDSFVVARGNQHTVRAALKMTMHNYKVEKLNEGNKKFKSRNLSD